MNQYYLLSNVILAASEEKPDLYPFIPGLLFSYLAVQCVVFQLFEKAIWKKLCDNDRLTGFVRPRLYGILWLSGSELLFLSLTCMAIYCGEYVFTALLAFISLWYGLYTIHIFCARLEYNETFLIYRSLRKTKVFAPAEVYRIERVDSGKSLGYHVNLYLLDGTELEFPEAFYVGTHALFRMFSQDDYEEPQDKQDPETKEATL